MDANALACVTTLFQQFFFPIGGRVLHDEAKETAVNESDEESGSESAVSHANFKVRVGVGCLGKEDRTRSRATVPSIHGWLVRRQNSFSSLSRRGSLIIC